MNAKTRWIVAIVGLLAGNLVAMGALMAAAGSGSSKVIPDYYDKAVHYDDVIDQAAKNRELGWRVTPRWDGEFLADVTDRDGAPLVGAHVEIQKRARTDRQRGGVFDLTIKVTHGSDVFVETVAVEAK